MYGNPSSAGQGQGAAQVFNTGNALNAFVRVSMMEQQQRQADEQYLAKMMTQFDPSKLRAKDHAEFNQMYNELQDLHIKNKDLYRNPLRNQEAYRKSQELINSMRTLAANSKAVEGFLSDGSKEMAKNKNIFSPDSVQKFGMWSNMSTSEIMAMNGGRLPSFSDVEYVPDEISRNEQRMFVKDMATSIGAVADTPSYIKRSEDPSIPEFKMREIKSTTVDNRAFPAIAQAYLERPKNEQYYDYQWRNLEQQERNAMRLKAQELGLSPNAPGALIAATVDLATNHSVLDRKVDTVDDRESIEALRDKRRQEDRNWQVASENRREARSDRRTAALIMGNQRNVGLEQINTLIETMKAGDETQVQKAITPLMALAPGTNDGKIIQVNPKNYKNFDEWWAVVSNLQPSGSSRKDDKGVETSWNTNPYFNISEQDARDAYNSKSALLFFRMPTTDERTGNITENHYIVNPKKDGIAQALYGVLSRNMPGASFERGVFPGYDEYPQRQVKVPKITGKK